jgi:pilus assembly protein Flp/PilA
MLKQVTSTIQSFSRDERGASLLEYTILLGIVTAVSVALIANVGTWVTGRWTALTAALGI